MAHKWGTGRHYDDAAVGRPSASDFEHLHDPWVRALQAVQSDPKGAVTRAKDRWNMMVRDRLRNETALRMKSGEQTQAVPVRIVDGMPDPFIAVIEDFRHAEWAILNEATLRSVIEGTEYMKQYRDAVRRRWPERAGPAAPAEIRNVNETARAWLALIEQLHTKERIVGINEDVLGAYFYRVPEVRLYWAVIGIVSRLLDVPIEALTVVVLAHELAHAYTHLGYDIDEERWETEDFASADMLIVEGLAQFYTKAVCEHLHARIPEAEAAFHKLLESQAPAYTSFQGWLPRNGHAAGGGPGDGEIIRASMIECRKRGMAESKEFVEAIGRHRSTIEGN